MNLNEGTDMKKLVISRLKEIEEQEQVKILHAVESGSRAWGLASPDSDYDVRFIYIRPMQAYLKLEEQKDFIDWELNKVLDINGWDLSKVLKHFHKSNAVMFEWANSPAVYYTTDTWKQIRCHAETYFSCKASMYHYYGTATKNYHEYLKADMVKYKKYFYVLRPILACKWIEERHCPPPVLFSGLAEAVLETSMRKIVADLIQVKAVKLESEKGIRIDELNDYIAEQLEYYKAAIAAMEDDRKPDWVLLNRIFLEALDSEYHDISI